MHWYEVLSAARKVGSQAGVRDGKKVIEAVPFTAAQLARAAHIKGTSKSTPERIAAAWIGKFNRWGYVLPEGQGESTGGRPPRTYVLTRWGLRFRLKKGQQAPRRRRAAANEEE